jgi:murein L,D-transpeptidase YcbB/YkuD
MISESYKEGLNPVDYHIHKIKEMLHEIMEARKGKMPLNPFLFADMDLLLSDAFLIYGSHLLAGVVNPETFDPEWHAVRREADLGAVLEGALGNKGIEGTINELLPVHKEYHLLKQALVRLRKIEAGGGWSSVPYGPKIQKGDRGERIAAIKSRLIISGDLIAHENSVRDVFDDSLERAIRSFQESHGLDADGVVGPATFAALNVPVGKRVRQIELNMERWRWLPRDLGKRYILVNIAGFSLDVYEDNQQIMDMRVVVGRQYRRTPVFSKNMTYLVISPYWNIPPNIALKDKLPLIRKNPGYLEQERIRVFHGAGAEMREIDPKTVDWATITGRNFSYRFRQDPGPFNALGRVKFMFPNKYNVYLHDTPSQELFAKTVRTFSSGCIRIEKPIELAEYLLRDYFEWTREKILSTADRRIEQTVQIKKPLPVHLLYWTAWIDRDGRIQFRDDIYGRDELLAKALQEKTPPFRSLKKTSTRN